MSKNRGRKTAAKKFVSGFVSILGRPNSGKSTLLNALTGTKLAIVADKPQTTRTTIQGVWTAESSQVVFVDTPGIHAGESLFNRRMMQTIGEALQERDLLLFLIDATARPGALDEEAVELIRGAGAPVFAVVNKIDAVPKKAALLAVIEQYRQWHEFEEFFPVSALTGEGLEELRAAIVKKMPAGPAWFPPDHVTDQPERFLAAEIVREKILAVTRQEVPHAVAVLVDEWKEEGRLTRISMTVHVERAGQKVILVGAKGARLKEIGTAARVELESILGTKVFLTLFVKVSPKWRENERFLKELDWRAMLGAAPLAPATEAEEEQDGPVTL